MAASPERHRGFLRRAPRDSQDPFISSPIAGSQAAMSATLGGSLSMCAIRACATLAPLHWFLWFLGFPRERPACPNVLVGFRSLSNALFGARQKVIRRASEDVSHLLKTIGWDSGTALVQAQACLATAQAFCELLLVHADAASLRCDVIHRFNLLSN